MRFSAKNVKLQISGNGVNPLRVQYFIALLVPEAKIFLTLQRDKSIYVEIHVFVFLISSHPKYFIQYFHMQKNIPISAFWRGMGVGKCKIKIIGC